MATMPFSTSFQEVPRAAEEAWKWCGKYAPGALGDRIQEELPGPVGIADGDHKQSLPRGVEARHLGWHGVSR